MGKKGIKERGAFISLSTTGVGGCRDGLEAAGHTFASGWLDPASLSCQSYYLCNCLPSTPAQLRHGRQSTPQTSQSSTFYVCLASHQGSYSWISLWFQTFTMRPTVY